METKAYRWRDNSQQHEADLMPVNISQALRTTFTHEETSNIKLYIEEYALEYDAWAETSESAESAYN
ncbi:hypothetical protein [Sodalis endosymbiont of Henestaris halophilus]|uniref:hypothetical protein n=1 Tax=Sodalis endosymbiont of Henestaris halophilus TaxID=1929246 RepID=UPI000BE380F8|nr:hypothetical protein [Sodalis endosymbiont of Henestaris halophilus]